MRIQFSPYVLIYTDNVDVYDVYQIVINEEEKTIDCSDNNGFMIANIHYENLNEVGCLKYDENERLTGESKTIIEKGNIVYGVDENDDSV